MTATHPLLALTIRRAKSSDVDPVAAMIHARCDWLETHHLPTWRDHADELAAQAALDPSAVWLACNTAGQVLGCTTMQDQAPPEWSPAEAAEPSLYLFSTVTHPVWRKHKIGTRLALWAVDHAARQGYSWVRRGCYDSRLATYYTTQGFTPIREELRKHGTLHLLARRAEILLTDQTPEMP